MRTANQRQLVLFLVAAVVLGGSALGLNSAKDLLKLQLIKKPIPIRKSLDDFDRPALLPYKVVRAQKLPTEIVGELGTEEYINWGLRDETAGKKLGSVVSLSVTYYTGVQDQLPHVPEECLHQANYQEAGNEPSAVSVSIKDRVVPIRRLLFKPPPSELARGSTTELVIYYTIAVNGSFSSNRTAVRTRMQDWRDSHLYYSKVELTFRRKRGSKLAAIDEAAGRLMQNVLTELVESHWPVPGSERTGISDQGIGQVKGRDA